MRYDRFLPIRLLLLLLIPAMVPIQSFAAPPTPPPAKKWVKNNAYSDEFNGASLDTEKWFDHHPYWQGRPPARFKPDALRVNGGLLRITNYKLPQPEYVNGNKFTMAGGAVVSKKESAHYGYYECRMKASEIAMSSTFWLKNRWNGTACPKNQTELDIIECIGGSNGAFATAMHSNTHYIHKACNANEQYISRGDQAAVGGGVADQFHVYGAWWEDATKIHFYIDDVYVYTIKPRTDYSSTPFNRPMAVHMVTETYDWHPNPSDADFRNPSLDKTTYYDWVRVWTLEDDTGDDRPNPPENFKVYSGEDP